ncbi:MAG: hypothetical protein EXR77_11935 [Myxococcales bacterium]|nr:hypothetical protein [Myxococcales bacterium]
MPPPGDICTVSVCTAGGVCKVFPAANGTPCSDGNACTGGDHCGGGDCQPGNPKDCNDGQPCTGDGCDGLSGACAHTPTSGAACDDGQSCTLQDACQSGTCVGAVNICPCIQSSDCGKSEDGNACNGVLYCDKSVFPNSCKVNTATIVSCPELGLGACVTNTCAPATGVCQKQAVLDGLPCDDGKACTQGDSCKLGVCSGGKDICSCKTDADCLSEDDGDSCNGIMFCNKSSGKCQFNPATVVNCPTVEDTLCRKNLCQPKSGDCALTEVNEGKPCLDGNLCTVGEVCEKGQ